VEIVKEKDTVKILYAIPIIAAAFIVKDHRKTPYDSHFDSAGVRWNVDSDLLRALARKENASFNPRAINKEAKPDDASDDSIGIMQINMAIARAYGIERDMLFDPKTNINAGARLMAENRVTLGKNYFLDTWIAAFNAGATKIINQGIFNWQYVAEVKYHYTAYKVGKQIA